ncbi:MAG: response regulator [Candidatus Omnitrophota bacterium]
MTKANLLVVEDEFIIAQNLRNQLTDLGYSVLDVVSSGERAIQLLEERRPDLVLMDIVLSGSLDGVEAANRIRSQFGIPVIYITAFADKELFERAKITEPYGYLLKPFEERELQANIEMAIYKSKTEKALKDSEERYRTVADFTYDWEFWLGTDGNFLYVSPSCERITGYPPEAFVNDPGLYVGIIHPEDRHVAKGHFPDKLDESGAHTVEFRIITKNNEVRWIEHCCQPVFSSEGVWLGRRGSGRDISKRKAAEREKERLIGELQEALSKVKQLSGLLPICSACKKIRDDKGYWNQLEAYIRNHSEADFTHSLCPECAKTLYPEFFANNETL